MNTKILKIIGVILLSISLFPLDYFFYQILKWYIFLLSGYLSFQYYKLEKEKWVRIFGISAVAFNPIAPIYFGREIWIILDIVLIGILTYNISQKYKI